MLGMFEKLLYIKLLNDAVCWLKTVADLKDSNLTDVYMKYSEFSKKIIIKSRLKLN